jgi:hypothetical protein
MSRLSAFGGKMKKLIDFTNFKNLINFTNFKNLIDFTNFKNLMNFTNFENKKYSHNTVHITELHMAPLLPEATPAISPCIRT